MGVVEVGAVGIAKPTTVLRSSGMFMAIKKNDVQSSQRVVPGNDRKKRQRRFTKYKRHIPIALSSCSPPSLSSSKSETLVFITGSSSKSSRTSSNPSSEDKFASSPQVAKLGMEEGVTTKEEPSFMAQERATKGSLAKMTGRVSGEALPI